MTYAVQYRDADGVSHQQEFASEDAAIGLVERLRNEEGPTDLRVFREVPIEVRTYYKVVSLDGASADLANGTVAPAPASDVPGSPLEPTSVGAASDELGPVTPEAPAGTSDDTVVLGAPPVPDTPSGLAALDPPSGAVVMTPPPSAHADPVDGGIERDAAASEPRRQLFGRG